MACKTLELCKISDLPPDSQGTINMILIYKLTEVKICSSLREHHDVTFSEITLLHLRNVYYPMKTYFDSYSTKSFTYLSKNNVYLENRKINILIKNMLRALCVTQLICLCVTFAL